MAVAGAALRWPIAVLLLLTVPSLAHAGRDNPRTGRPSTQPASAEVALAEGIFAEEFLRDPAAAIGYFSGVIADESTTLHQKQQATMRLARCRRRMNRPDEARKLLSELLDEPGLADDVRSAARAELAAMPVVEPARLMPADTLIYLEIPQPGAMLGQVAEILKRAGLYEAVRRELVLGLRQREAIDLSGLLTESAPVDFGKVEGLGIGWHNFRATVVDGRRQLAADTLFVLYTGQNVAAAGVFQGMLLGLGLPETTIEGVGFFASTPRRELRYAMREGLLVACTDASAGADALLRHSGQRRGPTLHGWPSFKRRPTIGEKSNAPLLFVDWPRLVEVTLELVPEESREEASIIVDMLALRQIGPIFGTIDVDVDRLELELTAYIASPDALLYRMARTPSLQRGWMRWVPSEAVFSLVTDLSPADRRWRDVERFLLEQTRVRSRIAAASGSQPADDRAIDPLAGVHRFEQASKLSVADDVFRPLNGAGVIWLGGALGGGVDDDPLTQWVMVLDVDQAEVWLRRLELGLRQYLFGTPGDAPLPTSGVETPVGRIETLPIPPTRFGLAWLVRGSHVVVALSVDALVKYLSRVGPERGVDALSAVRLSENKQVTLRVDRFLTAILRSVDPAPPNAALPPLVIRSYEQDDRVRLLIGQEQIAATLEAVTRVLESGWQAEDGSAIGRDAP